MALWLRTGPETPATRDEWTGWCRGQEDTS